MRICSLVRSVLTINTFWMRASVLNAIPCLIVKNVLLSKLAASALRTISRLMVSARSAVTILLDARNATPEKNAVDVKVVSILMIS